MGTFARRLTISLAALTAAAGMVSPAHTQTIVAGPTTGELTAAAGERVTVPIAIDMTGAPGINMGAYRLRLSWSPIGFNFVSASGGTFASPVFNSDSADSGVLRFAAASAAGASGIFTLADVTLEVQATVSDTFRVAFDELTAASSFQDLLPFLTVTSGSFCGSDVWGDLDGNGQIQSVDAQIVLMHSVGMAVADTGRGDVDPDSKVDPRDALVILSFVVGLDVSSFLVGQPISATCTPGDPDQVTVLPSPLSLAPGDQFGLSAQVRDSAGLLLAGKNLVWSSSDPAVATVDSTGVVTAVAAGTANVMAAVSPGVTGSTPVTVGQRTRWIVNPAVAQGQQDEVGSDQFPFNTIADAIAAAGAGDTIFIHVATYNEPLTTTKRLVFEGDSGATGMPTISTPNTSVGSISTTGKQTIKRLNFTESASGLTITADTLELLSVQLASLRGYGLIATIGGTAALRDVSVSGVMDVGLEVLNATKVTMSRVTVAGVESSADFDVDGVYAVADTVLIDSVTVQAVEGRGIAVPAAQLVRVQRSRVTDFEASGIWVDFVTTLEISDSVLIERGVGVGIAPGNIDTLRLSQATVRDLDGHALEIGPGAYDLALITDVVAERVMDGFVAFTGGGVRASVVTSRVTDADNYGMYLLADTLLVDRTIVERTGGRAVEAFGSTYARVVDSQLRDVTGGIVNFTGTGYLEVTGTAIRGVRGFADAIGAQIDSMVLFNDTIVGVSQEGGVQLSFADAFRMRDSHVSSVAWEGVYLDDVLDVEIVNVTLDSTTQDASLGSQNGAIEIYDATTARVDSNQINYSGAAAVVVQSTATAQILDNTFVGNQFSNPNLSGMGWQSYIVIYTYGVDSALIRNNVFDANRGGALYSYFTQAGETTVFDTNSVRGGYNLAYAQSFDSLTGRLELRGNQVVGDVNGNFSYNTYAWTLGSLIHEDNVIDSLSGWGIYSGRADTISVTGNSLTNVKTNGGYVIDGERAAVIEFDANTVSCLGFTYAFGVFGAGGLITNNTATDCDFAVRAGNDFDGLGSLTVENNRFIYGAVGKRPVSAINLTPPLSQVSVRNNYVDGGDFSNYVIHVGGNSTYHFPLVHIEGDTITSTAGTGVVVEYADTAIVEGNVITGLARGVSTGRKAAIWLSNVFDSSRVTRNTITGNALSGILFSSNVANILVDANLVADNADSGMVFWQSDVAGDTARGRFNTVRRNGVGIMTYVADIYLDSNNIEGNAVGLYNDDADTVFAANNWWGDVLGPRCSLLDGAGGPLCDAGAVGDSITGWASATYVVSPVAIDTIAAAPPGAPPAVAPGLASPALAATRSSAAAQSATERPQAARPPAESPSGTEGQGSGSAVRRSEGGTR
jgi:uncharacterized protein YjdB